MSEIILDMSGKAGLSDYSFGDTDMVTPQPNLRMQKKPGELASGFFNPYFREGYMAPAVMSTELLNHNDYVQDALITSVEHDIQTGNTYWATAGRFVYVQSGLSEVSTNGAVALQTGDVITDLSIYERDSLRTLYYTYTEDSVLLTSTISGESEWIATSISVLPSGTTKPIITHSESFLIQNVLNVNVTLNQTGAGSNKILIVIPETYVEPALTFSYDGVSMTKHSGNNVYLGGLIITRGMYYLLNPPTGTKVLSSNKTNIACTVIAASGVNQTTPIGDVVYNVGTGVSVNTLVPNHINALYLQHVSTDRSELVISGSFLRNTFDPSAKTSNIGTTVFMQSDGMRMYVGGSLGGNPSGVYQYNLGTAWDVSTSTFSQQYDASVELSSGGISDIALSSTGHRMYLLRSGASPTLVQYSLAVDWNISGPTLGPSVSLSPYMILSDSMAFSADGTKLYIGGSINTEPIPYRIFEFDLATAWDVSTLSYSGKFITKSDVVTGLAFDGNFTTLFASGLSSPTVVTKHIFNHLYPGDITRTVVSADVASITGQNSIGYVRMDGKSMYFRNWDNDNVNNYSMSNYNSATVSSQDSILETNTGDGRKFCVSTPLSTNKLLNVGTSSIPVGGFGTETRWLTDVAGTFVGTGSDYNFIRVADNGFAYLFAQNAVHKIDGTSTGGVNGTVTKNVILFPKYFNVVDAVDYRSRMYMAVHQYTTNVSDTGLNNSIGKTGIFVWNRVSTQFNNTDFIELPGVREIKKIYISPDQVLKLIVIAESGLTEIREYGYNDSGGVVFRVVKKLGIGAFPQYPDSVIGASDKTLWLANDGVMYSELGGSVVALHSVKNPGVTTDSLVNNIKSGAIMYGSAIDTADSGYRSNKQAVVLNYTDRTSGLNWTVRVVPFDRKDGNNNNQAVGRGDVYTCVQMLPVTAKLTNIRVYNLPITGTGESSIATVKVYYNQGTSAVHPTGITKTITRNEAKRGYVDFRINKQNIHAVQIEVEWNTSEPLSGDTYLPSVAVISYDTTTTQSPDHG